MNQVIKVDFDPKRIRLSLNLPFFLVDVARSFPSRRFDPKTKLWYAPLVAANIRHLEDIKGRYLFEFTEAAAEAIRNHKELSAGPTYVDFPYHLYEFTRSKVKYQPLDHQRRMLDLAWNLKSSAWIAKMGTGKTYAAVHLACARFQAGLINAVMVICPATLRATWRKEFEKFATSPYIAIEHETKSSAVAELYRTKPDGKTLQVLLVSVEGFGISEAAYDSACGFFPGREVFGIVDESSRIKNPKAKRTDRVINMREAMKYRIILNGTPTAIGVQDLYSQYEFLDPNIIGAGDFYAFQSRYVLKGGYEGKQIIGFTNVDELMRLIRPYTVEVDKSVLGLPPKVMKQFYCTATPEQKAALRLVKQGGVSSDGNNIKVENALEKVLRWRQIVGGWFPKDEIMGYTDDGLPIHKITLIPFKQNPKMDLMFSLFEENHATSKFIIWSTFTHEIEYIAARLAEVYGRSSVECYYGGTAMEDRSRIEDRYCNDRTMRFFVGNPTAAGLGLTLISGEDDVALYYSGTSAYIDRTQSEDRSHRIGQGRSVLIGDLVMEKTVDEVILAANEAKMSIDQFVMYSLKHGQPLNNSELTG